MSANVAAGILNIPTTAHYIGGCAIGASPQTGVVDPHQWAYGYPGLHVDRSGVTASLWVNPSLTIGAQAERAMVFWPNGEPDPTPDLSAVPGAHVGAASLRGLTGVWIWMRCSRVEIEHLG